MVRNLPQTICFALIHICLTGLLVASQAWAQESGENPPANPAQQVTAEPQFNDVRILIDVSGSMKKNDPKNLRSPALRLLVGLLPSDAQAAVWNFGTQVKQLVKLGSTDEKWKNAALGSSRKIHSKDLFTNIGQALNSATKDWQGSNANTHKRSLILLTDGMVDISKDDKKNQAERNTILAKLLPKLKKSDVEIHTIALSDFADKEFLEKISTQTDGSFTQTDKADELERIFLHLFEKTTEPDTIPLVDNNFKVDDSVYELTLLVFKDKTKPEQATEVVESSGKIYNRQNKPKYVKWRSEKNYDLITIRKPQAGDWSINASFDPDNRVMVVTNLKIQTNRIPNNIFLGEEIELNVFLSEEKEVIRDDDFLQLVSMSVSQEEPNVLTPLEFASGEEPKDPKVIKKWYLRDNGLRGDKVEYDGIFNLQVAQTLQLGKNHFSIRAMSETFERELNKTINVKEEPLLLSHLEILEGETQTIKQLMVTPNLEYMSPRQVQIKAQVSEIEEGPQEVELQQSNPRQLEWFLDVSEYDHTKDYQVTFFMQGYSRKGRPIKYQSQPITLNLNQVEEQMLVSESLEEIDVKVLVDEKTDTASLPEVEASEQALEETEEGIDWLMAGIITGVVNLVVGVAGWFFYRRWKNKQGGDMIDLAGEV